MVDKLFSVKINFYQIAMITHHVVHESFKNNISNNTHNIAQGGILFSGGQIPPLAPLNATLLSIRDYKCRGTTSVAVTRVDFHEIIGPSSL